MTRLSIVLLAALIFSAMYLVHHTRFGARERWIIRHLVEPFERVRKDRLPSLPSAHRLLLEEPVPAHTPQFNLDGFWFRARRCHRCRRRR